MKILSVDLGTRNLAWCILTRTASSVSCWAEAPFRGYSVEVHSMKLLDILEEGRTDAEKEAVKSDEINLNDIDIAKVVPWFTSTLKKYKEELSQVDHAYIEAQPTGRFVPGGKTVNNVKTKVLSHILQSFLLDHGVPRVQFISPKVKLKDAQHLMEDPLDYRQHKKAARLLTTQCFLHIDKQLASNWSKWWDEKTGKKDDLADAFLQGICAAFPKPEKVKRPRKEKAEPAIKKKKKTTDLQAVPAPSFAFEAFELDT